MREGPFGTVANICSCQHGHRTLGDCAPAPRAARAEAMCGSRAAAKCTRMASCARSQAGAGGAPAVGAAAAADAAGDAAGFAATTGRGAGGIGMGGSARW